MFLGHIALGLAGKRVAPSVSLATWLTSVQFVDLLWPIFLLTDLEHVRIAPGITRFTPLDFYDYPITHSLVGSMGWAALFAGVWMIARRRPGVAALLAAGVVSHWILDVISHRPDMPTWPHGPYVGLGLWNSVPATLAVELLMLTGGVVLYVRGDSAGPRRISFWLLIGILVIGISPPRLDLPRPTAARWHGRRLRPGSSFRGRGGRIVS